MHTKVLVALGALVAALAVSLPSALAKADSREVRAADPGVTATQILLGGTSPLSGAASAYASVARGADAYFKFVNARGGVNGRTIRYTYLDDAYNPAQTVQVTRRLVEQDKVFAVFNSLGTEQNLAVRDYLNQVKVPQLFVASGATTWGRDASRYPWTIGYQPSYRAEGWMYGKYLARAKRGARVAVLAQNDEYGKDLLAGLKQGVARSSVKIVAAQNYEVTASDVQSQVARLKASGANVFAVFATPKFAIQAYVFANRLGWRPLVVNNTVSAASNIMTLASEGGQNRSITGSISATFLKDPTDPRWANDPAIRQYRSIMARYARGANVKDVYHVYGMAVAYTTVEVLRAAGRNLTRAGVMAKARSLNSVSNPFVLPGIKVKTGRGDGYPIEQGLLQRWSKGSWQSFGGLWGYRAG
jgi:branched-chain amino acid transport system substrate-binding protein